MFLLHALENTHTLGSGIDIAAQTAVFVFPFFQALPFFLSCLPQPKGLLFKGSCFLLPSFMLRLGFIIAGF